MTTLFSLRDQGRHELKTEHTERDGQSKHKGIVIQLQPGARKKAHQLKDQCRLGTVIMRRPLSRIQLSFAKHGTAS